MVGTIWSIAVHGGARTIASDQRTASRDGCRKAVDIGAAILKDGGTALSAVEQSVRALEDDITFNAGSGSVLTSRGTIEMDAAIMDGETLSIGAIAALERVRHPVSVARLLLNEPTVLLVGHQAAEFAARHGVKPYDPPPARDDDATVHDTVGCVALDRHGHFAVATSTGGVPGQIAGRVGDAPIPGCGFYADDDIGAVAVSGTGETILRTLLATRVLDALNRRGPREAATEGLERMRRVGGEAGIITIDRKGRVGIAHNSDHFSVAIASSWLRESISGINQHDFEGLS